MERRAAIKNIFGVLIGYALLPKCLTPAKEVKQGVGVWEQLSDENLLKLRTFKMKMNCSWFGKGDVIKGSNLPEFIIEEKDDNGMKGRFLTNSTHFPYTHIEVTQLEEKVSQYIQVGEYNDKIKRPETFTYNEYPKIGEQKGFNKLYTAFIEEAETI